MFIRFLFGRPWVRTIFAAFGLVLFLGAVAFGFKERILTKLGNFLIDEDAPQMVDAIFVFSGGAQERGLEAAKLFQKFQPSMVYCTGSIVPKTLEAMYLCVTEGELTRQILIEENVPPSRIDLMDIGTSTMEECEAILQFCAERKFKSIMLVSSKFHTRRIRGIMAALNKNTDITVIVRGAPPLDYDEKRWWQSEDGLIFVNNEYVKLLYYSLAYS